MATNDTMTTTTLSARIPEVWANEVLGYLASYLNLAKTVTRDYEDEVAQYGDTINITKRGTLSANDKTQGENVTLQNPTESTTSLTLDNWKEVTFSPEDIARAEAKPKVLAGYMKDAALVLGEAVEDSLTALYSSADNSVSAGNSVGLADLREARRILVTNKVPKNTPKLAYIDEYAMEDLPLTDAAALGVNEAVVEGAVTKLGGLNLFESQNVATSGSPSTYHCMAYVEDAIALVVRPLPQDAESYGGAKQTVIYDDQTGISIRVTMSYNANALAPQVTLDILWGVQVLRSEHIVDIQHTNA